MICKHKSYTRLLWACSSLYDPRGFKVSAIRSLITRGANVCACCEAFGNSTLHLALLSTRDEVMVNGETWRGNSRDLQLMLRHLIVSRVDITWRNHAGLTPSDVAIGLKFTKSWNNAMQDCGLTSHMIDGSCGINAFRQDFSKQQRFEMWWEDCNHLKAGGAGLTLVLSKARALGGNNIGTSGYHTRDGMSCFLSGRSYEIHILQSSCHLHSCTILWHTLFAMDGSSEFTPACLQLPATFFFSWNCRTIDPKTEICDWS